jgi:hypothetical protein
MPSRFGSQRILWRVWPSPDSRNRFSTLLSLQPTAAQSLRPRRQHRLRSSPRLTRWCSRAKGLMPVSERSGADGRRSRRRSRPVVEGTPACFTYRARENLETPILKAPICSSGSLRFLDDIASRCAHHAAIVTGTLACEVQRRRCADVQRVPVPLSAALAYVCHDCGESQVVTKMQAQLRNVPSSARLQR